MYQFTPLKYGIDLVEVNGSCISFDCRIWWCWAHNRTFEFYLVFFRRFHFMDFNATRNCTSSPRTLFNVCALTTKREKHNWFWYVGFFFCISYGILKCTVRICDRPFPRIEYILVQCAAYSFLDFHIHISYDRWWFFRPEQHQPIKRYAFLRMFVCYNFSCSWNER